MENTSAVVPNGLTLGVALEALVCASERCSTLRMVLECERDAHAALLDDYERAKKDWMDQHAEFMEERCASLKQRGELQYERDEFQKKLLARNDEDECLAATINALRAEVAAFRRDKAKRARADQAERAKAKRVALKRKGLVHVNGIG